MLFALNDWAVSLENAARPVEPNPTWKEIGATLARQGRYSRASKEFVGSTQRAGEPDFDQLEVVIAARAFLDAWQHGRWAIVSSFMPASFRKHYTDGAAAKFAKDCFERFDLTSSELTECRLDQPSAAALVATVTCNGTVDTVHLRMAYWTDDVRVGLPIDGDGAWRLAVWAPEAFFRKPSQ